jgi:RimJ/RimL family protein N-acetyltransferase
MIIPETQRLLLRELEMSDLDALAEIYGSEDVMKYIGKGGFSGLPGGRDL